MTNLPALDLVRLLDPGCPLSADGGQDRPGLCSNLERR